MHSNLIAATRPDRELKGMEEKKRSYPDIMGRKMNRISFLNYFLLLPFRNRGKKTLEEYGFRAVFSGIE